MPKNRNDDRSVSEWYQQMEQLLSKEFGSGAVLKDWATDAEWEIYREEMDLSPQHALDKLLEANQAAWVELGG